jgi:hypothetical protein
VSLALALALGVQVAVSLAGAGVSDALPLSVALALGSCSPPAGRVADAEAEAEAVSEGGAAESLAEAVSEGLAGADSVSLAVGEDEGVSLGVCVWGGEGRVERDGRGHCSVQKQALAWAAPRRPISRHERCGSQ